jgi:hypothetical protein
MGTSSNVHEDLLFYYSECPHANQIVIMNYVFFLLFAGQTWYTFSALFEV